MYKRQYILREYKRKTYNELLKHEYPITDLVTIEKDTLDVYKRQGPGTGNCTRLFHGMLQSAVNAAKIETALLGKCKDTDCCWLLKICLLYTSRCV